MSSFGVTYDGRHDDAHCPIQSAASIGIFVSVDQSREGDAGEVLKVTQSAAELKQRIAC